MKLCVKVDSYTYCVRVNIYTHDMHPEMNARMAGIAIASAASEAGSLMDVHSERFGDLTRADGRVCGQWLQGTYVRRR